MKILDFKADVPNRSWVVYYNKCVAGLATSNEGELKVVINSPFCSVIRQPTKYNVVIKGDTFKIEFSNNFLEFS